LRLNERSVTAAPEGEKDSDLAYRFESLFRRQPTVAELERFRLSRVGLVLRLPGRTRRRAAYFVANC
jgi:hypothetical protein